MTPNSSQILNIPRHIAIIMDGNGRWARLKGLERSAGHVEGVNTVREITTAASELGVKFLTLYTFSTENWHRPKAEVDMLMHLIVTAIERETPDLIKNGVRLNVIGDMDRLPEEARQRLLRCIEETSKGDGLTLILAISYSSRSEITNAMRRIAQRVHNGEFSPDEITSATISENLDTAAYPDPDMLIRTGGDMRVSNFLLWQIAYTEIILVQKFWPDFKREDLIDAIRIFNNRERRFGLTGDQIRQSNTHSSSSPQKSKD